MMKLKASFRVGYSSYRTSCQAEVIRHSDQDVTICLCTPGEHNPLYVILVNDSALALAHRIIEVAIRNQSRTRKPNEDNQI